MENLETVVGFMLLVAMVAFVAWAWIMPDRAEREMRKLAAS